MNKPVAWINGNEICPEIGYEATITAEHPKDLGWIPLYTHPAPTKVKFASNSCESGWIYLENAHPVKELTDEEIQLLINDVPDYDIGIYELFEFAKAILRKAQEK